MPFHQIKKYEVVRVQLFKFQNRLRNIFFPWELIVFVCVTAPKINAKAFKSSVNRVIDVSAASNAIYWYPFRSYRQEQIFYAKDLTVW